jgi:PadR family transcriptional regulator, regulatory protein PadR
LLCAKEAWHDRSRKVGSVARNAGLDDSQTLQALRPQHGFGIARRIEQVSRDVLQRNEGAVYTSLLRLLQQRWIVAEWGTSLNNRKAKFYSITARGEKQLAVETDYWERISGVVGRVLRLEGER